MSDFKIDGLEEFQNKLKTIERKAPDRIINKLNQQGNRLRRETRKNTPEDTGKLKKSYKLTPVEKVGRGYEKGMRSNAPHFHLVERGYWLTSKSGQKIRWIEGKFMVEKTVNQMEGPIMSSLDKWLSDLFEELK